MSALISPQAMSFAEENALRKDFYKKYYDWVRAGNKHRNYESFKKYVINEFEELLKDFIHDKDNVSFKVKNSSDFEDYYSSLFSIKQDKHTVITDINSCLHILEKRKDESQNEYFLITADKKLITWLSETFPNSKSVADYPSTWLSIILKYSGRASDSDYKAFCQFIHLSIEPIVEDLEKKVEIKANIISSDFEEVIKEQMMYEVKNNYHEYKSLPVSKTIHKAYAEVTKQIEDRVAYKKDREKEDALNDIKMSYEKKLEEQQSNFDLELQVQKAKSYEEGKENQIQQQKLKDRNDYISKKVNRNKTIKTSFIISVVGILIIAILIWVLWFVTGKLDPESEIAIFLDKYTLFISGLMFLFEILLTIVGSCLKRKKVFCTDKDFWEKKYLEKYADKISE